MRISEPVATPLLAAVLALGAASVQATPPSAAPPVFSVASSAEPTNCRGRTPLMLAALKGDSAAVETLLAQGAAVNAKDKYGLTALMWAAPAVVLLLLRSGADVRARDDFRRTALTYAAFQEHASTVKALLDHGAEVDARDNRGMTPLLWAIERPDLLFWLTHMDDSPDREIATDLSRWWAGREAKVQEASVTDVVSLLLDRGADPNARDSFGLTPLLHCAGHSFCEFKGRNRLIVNCLLAKGADVNAQDNAGNTALMAAAAWLDVGMVELLRARGAALNAMRHDGRTALSIASEAWWGLPSGARERVKALLKEPAAADTAKHP